MTKDNKNSEARFTYNRSERHVTIKLFFSNDIFTRIIAKKWWC